MQDKTVIKRLCSYAVKLVALGFLAVGVICLLLVLGMICKGGEWGYIIYAEKPIPHFLGGMGALLVYYVLFHGIHNSAQDWLRFCAKVLLATISLALSLVAGEIGLRTYYSARQSVSSMEKFKVLKRDGKPMPIKSTHALAAIIQPSEDPRVIYELQPNLDMKFGHRRTLTNKDGIRESRDYQVEKTANSIRIIGIGDSGMFGWNIEQDEDYMNIMEANLNRRQDGTLYEVMNLAVPGYNTQLEVEMLRRKGLKYKPDIVVAGWCENDYSLPFFMLEKENYRRLNKSFIYSLFFKRTIEQNKHTEIAPGFRVTDQRDFERDKVSPELTTGSDTERVRTALKDLKVMGEQNNFKVLVFGPMKQIIQDLCKEAGIPFSSTYDLIPEKKYPREYLIHFMHPSKNGHSVLAEYLEKDLVKRGWIPPGPSQTGGTN